MWGSRPVGRTKVHVSSAEMDRDVGGGDGGGASSLRSTVTIIGVGARGGAGSTVGRASVRNKEPNPSASRGRRAPYLTQSSRDGSIGRRDARVPRSLCPRPLHGNIECRPRRPLRKRRAPTTKPRVRRAHATRFPPPTPLRTRETVRRFSRFRVGAVVCFRGIVADGRAITRLPVRRKRLGNAKRREGKTTRVLLLNCIMIPTRGDYFILFHI